MVDMGSIGVGIVDTIFEIYSDCSVGGKNEHSIGIWQSGLHHKGLKIQDLKFNKGDIITVDLDLNDRTIGWEINGQTVVSALTIPFDGPVAIAASLYSIESCAQIIQYFKH